MTRLAVPTKRREWDALRKTLRQASAADFPDVPPERFTEFRRLLLEATGGRGMLRWMAIGIAPSAILILTQYFMRLVRWGAIPWGLSAFWIIFCNFRGGKAQKASLAAAIDLGKQVGVLQ